MEISLLLAQQILQLFLILLMGYAVVLVMVPFYRLDKEMPAVRASLAHERKETAR